MKLQYRRTTIALCTLIATALLTPDQVEGSIITGLFNTGVDDNGNVLPLHSLEQHYEVSGASSVTYVVPQVYHAPGSSAWVQAPAGSAWIGPNATDNTWPTDPMGVYNYSLRITVNLTGYNLSQAQIAGLWATDNSGEIWLNGANTGFTTSDWGFQGLSSFLIQNSGLVQFQPGDNTLEFRVLNSGGSGNPSGLLVAGLRGVDDGSLAIPTVPESSPAIIGALLLLPLVFGAAKKAKRAEI